MSWILVAYMVTATSTYGVFKQWQPLGEFKTAASCEAARQTLGVPASMRCLEK